MMINVKHQDKQSTCQYPHHRFSLSKLNYEISVLKLFDWLITYNKITASDKGSLNDFLKSITSTSTTTAEEISSGIEDCISVAKLSLHNENDIHLQTG